jgi:hypothetical protein
MLASDTAKPATALYGEPALSFEHLGGRLEYPDTPSLPALQLRCDLVGSDMAIATGVKGNGALDLCRQLLAAGADPAAELLCFRNGSIALRVRSIGHGARLTVRETATDGPRIATWRPFPAARSDRPFVKLASLSIPGSRRTNTPEAVSS